MRQEETLFRKGDVLHETYRIDDLIGVGGTGEVYRAENTVSRRTVAIKILKREFSADERFIELMRRELLRDVNSEAVVNYYELLRTKEYGGLYFLVMEYIEGPPLAKLMAEGPVPMETLLQIAARVAAGLRAAHASQVLHRDISPDNIILRDGDPSRATLIDFGIAKDLKPEVHSVIQGGFAGKYQYAAPEQMDGKATAQSDIYSLGMTLLAAARGAPPELPEDLYAIRKHKDDPPDLSDLPEPLRGLFARMLAPDREQRIASAADLEQALAELGAPGQSGQAAPSAQAGEARRPGASRRGAPRLPEPERAEPERSRGSRSGATRGGATAPARPRRGRGLLIAGLGVVAAAAALAAFYVFGPGEEMLERWLLPHEEVYRLSAAREAGVEIRGHAPSEAERDGLIEAARAAGGGAEMVHEITLASGEPSEQWAEGLAELIGALAPLERWSLRVVGLRAVLQGTAPSEAVAGQVRAGTRRAAELAELSFESTISVSSARVASAVGEILAEYRSCGPLELAGGDSAIRDGGELRIRGRVAEEGAADELRQRLREVVGERPLSLDLATLNRHVCRFMSLVPETGEDRIEILYADGGTGQPWDGDTFSAGSNPLIDVAVAEEVEGYLYVLLVDNEGSVVNLLPHPGRQENGLDRIGEVVGDERIVRVAYPQSEASGAKLSLTFTPPFGANLVVALVSNSPLFDTERLRRESVEALAPEFQRGIVRAGQRGDEVPVVYRLLTVEEMG